jgi:hypothetical protein
MLDMDNQTLPLPNPGDWVSVAGAAAITRTSIRTITRRIADGRIKAYLPYGAADRPSNYILWRPEVRELGLALLKVKGGDR